MIGKTLLVTTLAGVALVTATPAEAAPKSASTAAPLIQFVFAPTLVIIDQKNYGSNNATGSVVVNVNTPASGTAGPALGGFTPTLVIISQKNYGRDNLLGDVAVSVNTPTPSTAGAAARRNSAKPPRAGASRSVSGSR
jgi:hypothetical protein